MKKMLMILSFIFTIFLIGCTSKAESLLKGTYQSELVNGYAVQMAFQYEELSFVQYIDNREIDSGTYEKLDINHYKVTSDKQDFEVILDGKGVFEVVIPKLNRGDPIKMKQLNEVPTYFSTEFNDTEEYESLLNDD